MKFHSAAAAFLCVLIGTALRAAPAGAETIRVSGSGGPLGVVQELAAEFRKTHPDVEIVVMPSLGTGGAVKAVMSGALQIGLASRPLTDEEKRWGIVATRYAATPFGFAVATRSGVAAISMSDAVRIYDGDLAAWPGGGQIRLVLRPESDSDTDVLQGISARMGRALRAAHARKGMLVAASDHDAGDMIQGVPGAFGTLTLTQIVIEKRKIRLLSLDGAEPTLANLAAGAYPFFKNLYLVTSAHPQRPTREFVDFVLSPAARKILRKAGQLEADAAPR